MSNHMFTETHNPQLDAAWHGGVCLVFTLFLVLPFLIFGVLDRSPAWSSPVDLSVATGAAKGIASPMGGVVKVCAKNCEPIDLLATIGVDIQAPRKQDVAAVDRQAVRRPTVTSHEDSREQSVAARQSQQREHPHGAGLRKYEARDNFPAPRVNESTIVAVARKAPKFSIEIDGRGCARFPNGAKDCNYSVANVGARR